MNPKRFLVLALLLLSLVAGTLISRMSFVARSAMGMMRKKYASYAFMKVWWQASLLVFFVLMLLFSLHALLQRRYGKSAFRWHLSGLILSLVALYFTYRDFRSDISHRWAGERLHLGFYLFWLSWSLIALFFMFSPAKPRDTDNTDAVVP